MPPKKKQKTATPSGYDRVTGEVFYKQSDVTHEGGKVSINLVPVGARLCIDVKSGYDGEPVFFDHLPSGNWMCSHQQKRTYRGKVILGDRCNHQLKSTQGSTNISSLVSHCCGGAQHWKQSAGSAFTTDAMGKKEPKKGSIASFFGNLQTKKSANGKTVAAAPTSMEARGKSAEDSAAAEPAKMPSVAFVSSGPTLSSQQAAAVETSEFDTGMVGHSPAIARAVNMDGGNSGAILDKPTARVYDASNAAAASKPSPQRTEKDVTAGGHFGDFAVVANCMGVQHDDFKTIFYPADWDFVQDYPITQHSGDLGSAANSKGYSRPTWNVMSVQLADGKSAGIFTSTNCTQFVTTGEASKVASESTASGRKVCAECVRLLHLPKLVNTLQASAMRDYGQTPDAFCPLRVVMNRKGLLKDKYNAARLQSLNDVRKISSLKKKCGDHHRFMVAVSTVRLPHLQRLLSTHLRSGGSLRSFFDKMDRASEMKEVGHCQYRRGLIPRFRKNKDGKFDDELLRMMDLAFIDLKLGGRRATKTHNVETGGFSVRHTQRLVNTSGLFPSHRVVMSPNCGPAGRAAIRCNMKAVGSKAYEKFIPMDGKCLVHILFDGIAVEKRLNVDTSVVPNMVTGLCRHCDDPAFITFGDATRIQDGLESGKFHHASEVEVVCLGLNHPEATALIPVAVSPTCKADEYDFESTHTTKFLLGAVEADFYECDYDKLLGPLSTLGSDGAGQFRRGAGELTSDILPPEIAGIYTNCPLFNTVGGRKGTTPANDLDHLGKRNRERGKSIDGCRVGNFHFNKVRLSRWFAMAGVVDSAARAERLLNPDDSMDVMEMTRYLKAVKKIAATPFESLPPAFKTVQGSRDEYRAVTLFGEITGCLGALIVGHHGGLDEDGVHMSVAEILRTASKLSFLFFFLFRKYKSESFPNQHYRNIQDTMKHIFVAVSLAKSVGAKHYIFFLDTTKRLEQLFGILRSMVGGDLNFDCLGLVNRLNDAAIISQIYARHPEWDSPPRKLTDWF